MRQRVLLMCTGLGRGGAETQLLGLARWLRDQGRDVTVLTLLDHNEWSEEVRDWQLDVRTLDVRRDRPPLAAAARLVREVRSLRPEVIGSFLVAANVCAAVGRVGLRVPRLVTSIRSVLPDGGWQPAAVRWTRRASDAVVFNSSRVRDDAVARGLLDADRCTVIRNALAIDRFAHATSERALVRQEWDVDASAFVWIAVGNVRPVKNYPALVRAFEQVHARAPHARLIIVGQPYGDVDAMQAEAPALWRDGVIRYLGQRTDVPRLLAGADAYALTSRHEGSPNTVIEAMAAGLPVVSTDVGGAGELLGAEARGWLAPRSNARDIADAMHALHDASTSERRRRASAGQDYVRTEHDPQRVFEAWARVLDA